MSDIPIQKGVRGGGFCGPLGSKGETTAQTDVTCTLASDGKGRWKLTPGAETAKERKRREARGNRPKRGSGRRRATLNSVGAAPTALPAALTPVPAAVPAAVPAPHPDPDAMLDTIPLDVQREIERRAGGDPRKAEDLAQAYNRDGALPVDPQAAYEKAVKRGVPTLSDEELQAARQFPDASPIMRETLGDAMRRRANDARQAKDDADLEAARKFRTGGSDADLAAAREAAGPHSAARRELDRQAYLRGLDDAELARQAAQPMSDFDREQYAADAARRRQADPAGYAAADLLAMRDKIPTSPDHGVTKDGAAKALDGLTNDQLRDVARGIGAPAHSGLRSRKDLVEHVVGNSVGGRLNSYAMNPRYAQPAQEAPAVKPVDMSRRNDAPLSENMWGAGPHHPVSYHPDGDWGRATDALGADARVDYDGLPLKEHLDRTATEVIRGEKTTNDAIAELRRVRDRLPADSRAHRVVDGLIEDIDHPMTPAPQVPEGAHPAFAQLAQDLHSVPAARRDTTEIERVLEMARQSVARPNRNPRLWASDLERQVHNLRHESNGAEGKFDIDRAVRRAVRALEGTR